MTRKGTKYNESNTDLLPSCCNRMKGKLAAQAVIGCAGNWYQMKTIHYYLLMEDVHENLCTGDRCRLYHSQDSGL